MNKKGKTTIWLNQFMALVLLVSTIYILIPENVKIDVEKTKVKIIKMINTPT
ncbi:hypothetical protein LCGC14_1970640, partial [marine sediment metagenome]